MRRATPALPVLLLLALVLPGRGVLHAQGSTDVITGEVRDATGAPVAGAQVSALSAESGVRRSTISNQQGRFTLVFPEGGGAYQLTVTFAGMTPVVRPVARVADEEVLVANVRLEAAPVLLEGVEVTARRDGARLGREPGAQERVLSGEALDRLPIDPSDLAALATLTPGVVMVGDSLGAGFSVLGQGPAGNRITLDGATFGGMEGFGGGVGSGVPSEAVRVTRVITNSYDVSRGQFSGGQIATTTRAGTNTLQGSFTAQLRDPALQWTDAGSPFDGSVRQNRVSGGVGGPILRNRLFYFGSFSWQRRSEDLASLLSADPLSLQRLGVSPDSVGRLRALVASGGVYGADVPAPDDRVSDMLMFLGRVDYNVTDAHTVTLRADRRWFAQDAFRTGALGFPQGGGTLESGGAGLMATLTSRFGAGWINELRTYASRDERATEPYQASPEGRVRVTSDLEDGTRAVSTLSFGGGGVANDSRGTSLEISDELSLLLGLAHRVRLGATLSAVRSAQEAGSNRYGTFTYQSLEDLAANDPASFTRTLTLRERESGGWNGAVYLGDTWRATERLQLTVGTRVESSGVAARPEHNPEVESVFGRRTDRIPTEAAVTPRVGFSYTLGAGEGGPPAGVLRGGFGAFRATPPWSLFATARDLTGLPEAQAQLFCVGPAVPTPDWGAYLQDPASIPTACAGGLSRARASGRGTSVAVFDDEFRAPQSWRASLGFQRRIQQFLGASLDLTYAEGVYQQGLRDLNLREAPAFALAEEGGRPVYVPAQAIVPRTGEVGFLASRRHPRFGQVLEVNSGLRSRTTQMTLGLNGFMPASRVFFSGSYTYGRSRDQGSGGGWGFGRGGFGGGAGGFGGGLGSLPPTAGNPNEREWATSDFERLHSVTTTLGRSVRPWLDFTLIGRASSGSPFSPLVGSDINGDGARNDLAFVFDPATAADPVVAAGMDRLLGAAPQRVRECLAAQLGELAERNSCRQPWSYALDLRLNLRPTLPQLGRRLSISVDALNTLQGLDRLLHGADGLRGWGQQARSDPVLLYPRGFDPAARRYLYEVNERFGASRSGALAFRNPFLLQIQGQMTVGRGRGEGGGGFGGGGFGRGRGGSGGGFGGGPGSGGGADPAALISRMFPNPVSRIIALRDSLRLDAQQLEKLTALAGALQQRQDSLGSAITREVGTGPGGRRDMSEVFRALQPRQRQSRENVQQALAEAQRILTPEQWARVPEEVRDPPRAPGGRREGGRRPAGERRP